MREFYRRWWTPLASSIIIGISAWCAAGTVAVVSAGSAYPRLIAPAPWWVALLAAGVALLVPGWRARPVTAMPALLATMPWWPVPIPAEALIWTGALAWAPIASAFLVSEGGRFVALCGRAPGTSDPARATRLAAVGALLVAALAAWAVNPRVPGGDEPHYLVITQSLLQDGDLQIENNHAARDYAAYFGGTIAPDYLVRGQNGAIYSIHAPGVSALVLPGFALMGFRGAQVTLVLVFAVTGALVWRSAWRLTGDVSAAWFAWAAVVGSTTMAVLSAMVFPDAPGACAVAAGVWLLISVRDVRPRGLVAVSTLLAALPWLHTRFSVLAGLLGVAIAVAVLADTGRPMAGRWRRAGAFVAVPLMSALLWLWSFFAIYGTADPRVPYGPHPELRSWIWGALAGLFVDQQFGLLTYAPVLAVAGAAVVMRAPRAWRLLCAVCLGSLLLYAMAASGYWMWWAGVPGLPARFLTAAVPLLGVPLAVVWSRSTPAGRSALLALLAVSLATTAMVLAVERGAMAWNARDGQAAWLEWLNPVVNLPRAWPSFFWNGEAAFLRHAGLIVAVWAVWSGLWLVVRAAARLAARDAVLVRLAVAVWLLMGTMVMADTGWRFTGSAPVDPSRAQLQVHAAAGEGRAVYEVGATVRRWDAVRNPLRIRADEAPLMDRPSAVVMAVANVPAGAYRLDVSSRRIMSGDVVIRIGRSAEPLYRFTLALTTRRDLAVTLPAGAAVLVVEASSPEAARALDAALVPASPADASRGFARLRARWRETDAFFRDDNVFVEAAGFWVKGGRTAGVVLSQGAGFAGRTRVLLLRNGGAANTVTIRSGAWQEVVSMAAGQERVVGLPAADARGAWPLTITSASGFQPSATSGGTDTRSLGVWVQ
jgi:hypothetical protein